jgi:hypoxanthine phosphoribosyltransferase
VTTIPGPVAITAAEIERRIAELAAEVGARHPSGVVLLAVLPEAERFAQALAAQIAAPTAAEAITVTRFGSGETRARLLRSGSTPLAGRRVLIATTIIDTGLRLRFAAAAVAAAGAEAVGICALLDRPDRRIVDLPLDHVGFTVPDCLFAGYGLGGPAVSSLDAVHYRDAASAQRAHRSQLSIA